MRAFLLSVLLTSIILSVKAQNTDLPSPASNIQTLPAGSYVIAMDNTNQLNNSSIFNYRAYGLIVTLLNNNKVVKWVIKAGKIKDSSDFSVNATRFKPTAGSAANFYFKAGPFVIFDADTTGIAAIIDTYNATISNANDKIKVYKTNASVDVDVRYNLTGFIPKALVLTNGGNANIHTKYMETCKIPAGNYRTGVATDLLYECFTFASEPHDTKTGQATDDAVAAVKTFATYGGNFLAQCEGILTYENHANGKFQTTTGITDANSGAGTAISYPNPDLAFSQFQGNFDISVTGSLQNWRINAAWKNGGHKHSKANADTTVIGSSACKMRSGAGGMIFYLGNHEFDNYTDEEEVNGLRMYMNAFLTPTGIGNNCTIEEPYAWPLAVRIFSFQGAQINSKVNLNWKVGTNEMISYFIIEKSTDGINYIMLDQVQATLNNGPDNYLHTDPMTTDKVFYRLKVMERSGNVSYSRILIFQSSDLQNNRVRIINNPVTDDQLNFEYYSGANQPVELRVIDMNGRVQFRQLYNIYTGNNACSILLPSALQPGMYLLDLGTGSQHYNSRFIKL